MLKQFLAVAVVLAAASASRAQELDDAARDRVKSLNSVTGDNAATAKVRELAKDKDACKKLLADGKTFLKGKEKDLPLNYTACFILARAAHATKDYDSGEYFYKLCVEHAFRLRSSQKLAQVFDGLINMFERAKRYDDALFICDKFLGLDGDPNKENDNIERVKPLILEQKVVILTRQKKYEAALDLVDKLVKADDGGWYFVLRKADVLREAGKFDQSAETYKEASELIDKSDRLKDDEKKRFSDRCNYLLGSVCVDLDQLDKAIELMEKLAKDNPDNATYQNDLGYVLADHDRRLDDAQKMVEKALELDRAERKKLIEGGDLSADDDRDNSAYLDSLAWVHFKKKNYDKALELMNEVIKADESQHPEIYDHLGDIYMAKGQTDEAVKAWKKAVELDGVNHRDIARKEAIRKKIAKVDAD